MNLPKSIRNLIESFEKLPGIGGKTAARLTFYLLHVPQEQLEEFAEAAKNLKLNTILCQTCFNVADTDPCPICADPQRDKSTICVVEQPLDALAIEKGGYYKGVYHVLHGVISPLDNIGPDELYIGQLLERAKARPPASSPRLPQPSIGGQVAGEVGQGEEQRVETSFAEASKVKEIILAMNPNMEGEATAMYLSRRVKGEEGERVKEIKITRLGQGLPTGGDLEYADEMTLKRAWEGRRDF